MSKPGNDRQSVAGNPVSNAPSAAGTATNTNSSTSANLRDTNPGTDLSDGEDKPLAIELNSKLNPFARDVKLVRNFQIAAVLATAFAIAILLCLLWQVVHAFSDHINNSTTLLKITFVDVAMAKAETSNNGTAEKATLDAKSKISLHQTVNSKSASAIPMKRPEFEQFYSMISANLTSLSTSVVAVISILVVAITVTTIAILRSTLSLSPYHGSDGESKKSEGRGKEDSADKGYALPGIEIAKAIIDALSSAVKGFGDKK